jgi:hypothetical protein
MMPRKVRGGVKKICIFNGVFDLVPSSVEGPLIFLGCWLAGTKGQMYIFLGVQVSEHTIDKCALAAGTTCLVINGLISFGSGKTKQAVLRSRIVFIYSSGS